MSCTLNIKKKRKSLPPNRKKVPNKKQQQQQQKTKEQKTKQQKNFVKNKRHFANKKKQNGKKLKNIIKIICCCCDSPSTNTGAPPHPRFGIGGAIDFPATFFSDLNFILNYFLFYLNFAPDLLIFLIFFGNQWQVLVIFGPGGRKNNWKCIKWVFFFYFLRN